MKGLGALLAAAGLAGAGACAYISFNRGSSHYEAVLQQEIHAYFNELEGAFAARNAEALASLFDDSITRPMAKDQIQARARAFFAGNESSHLTIDNLTFEELANSRAVVTVAYKVDTPPGRLGLGGIERATLVKRRGRWYLSNWEEASKP